MARARYPTALCVAVLGALMLLPSAGGRQVARPPYLTPLRVEISLGPSWTGARRVATDRGEGMSAAKDPGTWVWAPRCEAGRQTAVFRRRVELLGPLSYGRLSWNVASQVAKLDSFEVYANDRPILRWRAESPITSVTLAGPALRFFRAGSNEFELRATKARLPKGVTRCNVGQGQPYIAVTALLDAGFATDVRAGIPREPVVYSKGLLNILKAFVKNEGPDISLDGELEVYHGGQLKILVLSTGAGATCTEAPPGGAFDLRCRYEELGVGQRIEVTLGLRYTPDGPGWDHYSTSISTVTRTSTPDTNHDNDSSRQDFVLCEKTSTLEGCKAAR